MSKLLDDDDVQLGNRTLPAFAAGCHLLGWLAIAGVLCLGIPRFRGMFAEFGVELPQITRFAIILSDLFVAFWRNGIRALGVTSVAGTVLAFTITRSGRFKTRWIIAFVVAPLFIAAVLVGAMLIPLFRLLNELS